ncbi:hypothetical protein HGRIS_008538 [Hohenbuehelia grisea]|uniref:F-box domain-containing protein n=1 Tax=Hohenbuehelia grisea TaxID=104357 RepID=A0ABR3J8B2_9AGAR
MDSPNTNFETSATGVSPGEQQRQGSRRHGRSSSSVKSLSRVVGSPISGLPTELLRLIFSACVQDHAPVTQPGPPCAWILAMVCGVWRAIMLADTSLWTTFSIANDHYPAPQFILEYLRRSGGLPLQVALGDVRPGAISPSVVDCLNRGMSCWRTLELGPTSDGAAAFLSGRALPLLRRVEVEYSPALLDPTFYRVLSRMESLVELVVASTPYEESPYPSVSPFKSLREADLNVGTLVLARVLPTIASTLVVLRLTFHVRMPPYQDTPWHGIWLASRISFPCLRELYMVSPSTETFAFAQLFEVPALEKLVLDCEAISDFSGLASMLTKSACRLQALRVACRRQMSKPLASQRLAGLLESAPHIRSLELRLRQDYSSKVFIWLTDSSHASFLESLSIDVSEFQPSSPLLHSSLQELLKARCTPPSTLKIHATGKSRQQWATFIDSMGRSGLPPPRLPTEMLRLTRKVRRLFK